MQLRPRQPRIRDEAHLKFVRQQECCIPFCKRQAEAAHIRMACLAIGKRETGGGERPSDCFVVSLCPYHHRTGIDAQHKSNEAEWWERTGLNQWAIAASLWIESGGAARALEPKPAKRPRKIKARDRNAPKRKIQGRPLQSRSTFPPGRKFNPARSYEEPNEIQKQFNEGI